MATNRATISVVALALLAVVGLGLTAATIDSTYSSDLPGAGDGPGGPDQDGGAGPSGEVDRDESTQVNSENRGEQSPIKLPKICIEPLTTTPGILALIASLALAVGAAYWRTGFIGASFVGYLFGLPMVAGYGLVTQCPAPPGSSGETGSPLGQLLAAAPLGGSLTSTPIPPSVLIGIFGLTVVAAVAALVSASGTEDLEPPSEIEEEETDLEEFAAAAGEAADRIESTDANVDNAVYRAWQEMTRLLDIPNPESNTAGMFSDAAVEAGMGEEDIDQLTRLFEEVRYGDMDPEPREELALETLRRIEARYSSSEGTDANGGGDE